MIPCKRCLGSGREAEKTPEELKKKRESAGVSLGAVAREAGLSVPYLWDVENGKRRVTPKIEAIYEALPNG